MTATSNKTFDWSLCLLHFSGYYGNLFLNQYFCLVSSKNINKTRCVIQYFQIIKLLFLNDFPCFKQLFDQVIYKNANQWFLFLFLFSCFAV